MDEPADGDDLLRLSLLSLRRPRVPTYINAYSTHEAMQAAVVEALMGRRPWNRNSPVDPFAGAPDARY
ncbi:hypothetical protein LZK73_32420 (plasmid) [Neorhizobium galegae]|nr:hypothetical protein LZK73_32420 [Neorhizobium galegae]